MRLEHTNWAKNHVGSTDTGLLRSLSVILFICAILVTDPIHPISQASANGDFNRGTKLSNSKATDDRNDVADILIIAAQQERRPATEKEGLPRDQKMAAATSAFARGELAFSRLQYRDAANHFLQAAEYYPSDAHTEKIKALDFAGRAFYKVADFQLAENALKQAFTTAEAHLDNSDPLTARVLNNLAWLYQDTNRMEQAEPLMVRVVSIFKKSYGDNHPNDATHLNNQAQTL